MTNPFERDDVTYLVLTNDEGQHSLWPSFVDIPAGWTRVATGTRQECFDYSESHWTDMRPASLIRGMENS